MSVSRSTVAMSIGNVSIFFADGHVVCIAGPLMRPLMGARLRIPLMAHHSADWPRSRRDRSSERARRPA